MSRIELIGIGELLMDMTPIEHPDGYTTFMPNPGGAPCNFLAMAQKMGSQTAFIGKVGADTFGETLRQTIEGAGIDIQGLVLDPKVPTTLAFVHLNDQGDRSFSFYRKGCADVSLRFEEIDLSRLDSAKGFYFGSLAFTDEPLKSAVEKVLERVKSLGITVFYDPNYRPLLWPSEAEAVAIMSSKLSYADVLKVSEEEAMLLTETLTVEEAMAFLMALEIPLVCITLGGEGVLAGFKETVIKVPADTVPVVDTTGAGDAFFGTLAALLMADSRPLAAMEVADLRPLLMKANRAAGYCVQHYGAIPALPDREYVVRG